MLFTGQPNSTILINDPATAGKLGDWMIIDDHKVHKALRIIYPPHLALHIEAILYDLASFGAVCRSICKKLSVLMSFSLALGAKLWFKGGYHVLAGNHIASRAWDSWRSLPLRLDSCLVFLELEIRSKCGPHQQARQRVHRPQSAMSYNLYPLCRLSNEIISRQTTPKV